jgi:hypothetical protein
MCVGISICTNTQMFTFCTYVVDFNSFELLMNNLLAFKYQPIKIKHMCIGVFMHQAIDVYIHYLFCEYQLIWTYNEWFMCVFVSSNQIQAHVHTRAGIHCSVY